MTRLKITGITDPDDAAYAVSLGADIVSCVFYARSERYVTAREAWAVRRSLPPGVQMVGVFVDTPSPLVQRVIDQCQLDGAQLFGAEPREEVRTLRPWAFKAVSAATEQDVALAGQAFVERRARRTEHPGLLIHLRGAIAERWDLVRPLAERAPVVLASDALSTETLSTAIEEAKPWAVDVWECVEQKPGRLDRKLLEAFVQALDHVRQPGTASA